MRKDKVMRFTDDKEDILDLLNVLLDDRIEMYGLKNTIGYLLDYGLSKQELLDLDFEEEDVDKAIEEDY